MAQKRIPATMKALRLINYNENYQLRTDVPVPTPGPGELLIRVAAAGFCHTDYQVYQGVYGTQLPFTGSHEPAGTVVKLGSDVPGDWKVDDRVGVVNFREPCNTCNGCRWRMKTYSSLDARYCENKTMSGILKADGGFAEYMVASHYALVRLPNELSFEQAAPLMCAGATVWNAIKETGLEKGSSVAIVGIGGLGVLAIQFAKARGLRVVAIDNRDVGLKLASEVPANLRPDITINFNSHEAIQQISEFTDGIGLNGAVVCTDDVSASDWALHRLQPRGVCVVLGLPESGFKFDAFNLVFREIVVKGSLHCPVDEAKKMIKAVVDNGVVSHLTILTLEEGEDIPERAATYSFTGRLVIKI
ncbi:Polyketide synthase, enoylreductase [Penicillium expansum]|uniref:Polyketide synthase, enoylreductase n=1 Tax=Penicillium expansum TaxID=27334 RepID=A0A0A2IDQ3_PENEN|nr:Polyketide synthase, enoylreductase [Penicillium expansum]KGO40566.1 Polyketide synthase, enoylreductase [Penicillium expansum]KGO63041.1 Polyketide synthase, enoylreductase [Penicillium expansum]KGO67249.1 Polyketide synthase, enoylreductase [Penicillium expansum]